MLSEIGLRRCAKCQRELSLTPEFFFRDKTRKDGFCYTCKACDKARTVACHQKNPVAHRQAVKRYAERHPERKAAMFRRWANAHKEHLRVYKNNVVSQTWSMPDS